MSINASALQKALIGVLVAFSLLVAAVPASATAAPAAASQFALMDASFLATAPAPPHPATLCLIDTGVNVNPGTEAALVRRETIDGGSPNDNVGHGTMLVQSIAAPAGFGFTGLWPRVQIISERVTDSSGAVWMSAVVTAINRCTTLGASVINMSLAGPSISGQEPALAAAIANAQAHDIVLVAGAGNDNGGSVEYPAALPGVLAVGAVTASGAYCALSAQGPPIALTVPGCNLDISATDGSTETGDGTSFSSVYVATLATALRAYSGLSAAATVSVLTRSAGASGHEVDAAAAFRLAGLGVLTSPPPVHRAPPVPPALSSALTGPAAAGVVSAHWTGAGVRVRARLPRGLHMLVRVRAITAQSARAVLLLPVTRVPTIEVAFANVAGQHSRWVRVAVH